MTPPPDSAPLTSSEEDAHYQRSAAGPENMRTLLEPAGGTSQRDWSDIQSTMVSATRSQPGSSIMSWAMSSKITADVP